MKAQRAEVMTMAKEAGRIRPRLWSNQSTVVPLAHKGELSELCLWTNLSPSGPCAPSLPMCMTPKAQCWHQAALEDLHVPNKFADAFSCSHKYHEEVCRSRCSSKVALQGRSTNCYEDFHVDNDTDEREVHLDELVGPQLEPQLSTLTRAGS